MSWTIDDLLEKMLLLFHYHAFYFKERSVYCMIVESWMEMEIIGKENPTNISSFTKTFWSFQINILSNLQLPQLGLFSSIVGLSKKLKVSSMNLSFSPQPTPWLWGKSRTYKILFIRFKYTIQRITHQLVLSRKIQFSCWTHCPLHHWAQHHIWLLALV